MTSPTTQTRARIVNRLTERNNSPRSYPGRRRRLRRVFLPDMHARPHVRPRVPDGLLCAQNEPSVSLMPSGMPLPAQTAMPTTAPTHETGPPSASADTHTCRRLYRGYVRNRVLRLCPRCVRERTHFDPRWRNVRRRELRRRRGPGRFPVASLILREYTE